MAKAFLICGKICCGKSTYAYHLRDENKGILLSVDELMLALFGPYSGDNHDLYTKKIQEYLLEKSVEIIQSGHHIILDWGFWTKDSRIQAKEFYQSWNVEYEFHFIDINDNEWKTRIAQRNHAVLAGKAAAYPVDENLAAKFEDLFELPSEDEIDVWVHC